MMAIIRINSVLILFELLTMGASQGTPYKVDFSYNGNDKRDLTLYCKDIVGMAVVNAMFYRNGADSKTDECLNTTVYSVDSQKGRISLLAKSECDGYYMCGVETDSVDDDPRYILSGPKTIYTPPREIGSRQETIKVGDGETVTLPCKISSSPLNMYTITWYKYHQGSGGVIENPTIANNNSLVLENVRYGVNQGVYHCRVVVQGTVISSVQNGAINLEIYRKFFPPVFATNLTYSMDEYGNAHFTATAAENEYYPIHYQWFVNGTQYNSDGDEIDVKGVNYGITKVSVTIWNEKYTGSRYSEEQEVFVDRVKTQDCNNTVIKEDKIMSAGYGENFITVILAVALSVSIVIIMVLIIALIMCWCCYKQRSPKSNVEEERVRPDTLQNIFSYIGTDTSIQVREKGHVDFAIKLLDSLKDFLIDIHKEANTEQAKETLCLLLTEIASQVNKLLSIKEQFVPNVKFEMDCHIARCPNGDEIKSDGRKDETKPITDKEWTEDVCDPIYIRWKKLEELNVVVSQLLSELDTA